MDFIPIIIAISGVSGSGKTTLTKSLAYEMNSISVHWDDYDKVSIFPTDYVEWYKNGAKDGANAWIYDKLVQDLNTLKQGLPIISQTDSQTLKPSSIIFFDAPWGKDHSATGKFIDLWIHLDTPLDICLARRMLRDFKSNSSQKDILEELSFYLDKSRPMFTMAFDKKADIFLDGSLAIKQLKRFVFDEIVMRYSHISWPVIWFKPIKESDFGQLYDWLRLPHVAKWWYPDILPWGEFVTKYTKNLESKDVEGYLIQIDNQSVGFIQGYNAAHLPNEDGVLDPFGTWGMDLYIADINYLGKGFGPKILKFFMEKLQKENTIKKFIIDPHVENKIAIRTYEKVGFKAVKEETISYGKVLIMEKQLMPSKKISYEKLVNCINAELLEKKQVVIAISGFGGSGKSTLAEKLRQHFLLKEEQVLRIDELYSQNPDGADIFDQSDWPLLREILKTIRTSDSLKFVGRDSNGDRVERDETMPRLVIVEGVRLLQPDLMSYFDISVWVDCPQDFAKERAKARDRLQGEDEATVNRWDTDWGPKDKIYFETYRPDDISDFLYEDFK